MQRLLLAALIATFCIMPSSPAASATLESALPGGRWYSQTGLPSELGFALVDDGQARFWSEFQRHGGVDALGYPISHRFEMDGFTVQATQRVIMQWRPEVEQVYFVNVFDRMHELGHDRWLETVRQTPPPQRFEEADKPWEKVVSDRLALLDGFPAIRARYFAAVGDPIQANGLPTAPVRDVGNHYALRAQRVVFQQWKEKVPWADAGQVTVALGGDIAKEMGLLPSTATRPAPPPAGVAPPAPSAGPVPEPASTPGGVASPIGGDPAEMVVAPIDVPGARIVDEEAIDALTRRTNTSAARLSELGLVRGHRRTLLRDGAPTQSVVYGAAVDLFRDPDSARAYWQADARTGWRVADQFVRAEPVAVAGVGDDVAAFRVVSGESAASGYIVLFRRANAIAFVYALSQAAFPDLADVTTLARAVDSRLR